jgi:hypothetical protein
VTAPHPQPRVARELHADDICWTIDGSAPWPPTRPASATKAAVCRAIAWLPCRLWAPASALVRLLWRGYRGA